MEDDQDFLKHWPVFMPCSTSRPRLGRTDPWGSRLLTRRTAVRLAGSIFEYAQQIVGSKYQVGISVETDQTLKLILYLIDHLPRPGLETHLYLVHCTNTRP